MSEKNLQPVTSHATELPVTAPSIKKWHCVNLPETGYRDAWKLQTDLVAARRDKIIDTDIVIFLEHPEVFTLGRRGGLDNLTVSEDMLRERGIPIIQVERGGDITFHGPGQLVIYPIVDLTSARLGVVDYVEMLEEVIIRVAADWGITAERNPMNRGVWVGNSKLGNIGIAVRRGIAFHGVALNVNLSLEPFTWMNPCGLKGIGITSLAKELGRSVPMEGVLKAVKRHLENVFEVELVMTGIEDLGIDDRLDIDD
ncbi:MAG: lipoyl(octanoyl) transferase LipB [Deltaproteobacteria bacterium]|nr:lipoyl(octanoyl) transferase LipB [Deltaproteobacteria bacterium]